jgi:signal peptidase I
MAKKLSLLVHHYFGGDFFSYCYACLFFADYVIPTPSMEPAIMPGDKVIVYKMIPGPRIIRNFFSLHKGEKPEIKRLKGMRAIRRNDVLIFNFPYSGRNRLEMDMSVFYAKHCVAIPGIGIGVFPTLQIRIIHKVFYIILCQSFNVSAV